MSVCEADEFSDVLRTMVVVDSESTSTSLLLTVVGRFIVELRKRSWVVSKVRRFQITVMKSCSEIFTNDLT